MRKKKQKRERTMPTLEQREAERARKREEEKEQLRAQKFRLPKENNPYDEIEAPKKRKGKKSENILVSKDTIYKRVETIRNFPWFKLSITLALIFMVGLSSAAYQARKTDIRNDIRAAERELRGLQQDIFIKEAELRERYTFEEIERIATERLGMTFPDASQIIFINVPRVGGVTLNTDENILPQEKSFFGKVSDFFSGIFN